MSSSEMAITYLGQVGGWLRLRMLVWDSTQGIHGHRATGTCRTRRMATSYRGRGHMNSMLRLSTCY